MQLEERLKDKARRLGFELVGIAPATPADGFDRLRDWLHDGCAGEMHYMHQQAEARRHPSSILPSVRSVVMTAMNHKTRSQGSGDRSQGSGVRGRSGKGRVASYALGADYHDVMRGKLNELLDWVRQEVPGVHGRGVVDTAPLLERDFARRAGLGWIGKNTMLIHKKLGSFLFLGALLLDLPLRADEAFDSFHCGTCTACLDACPTEAFTAPGLLDARRCISYLTIELRQPIDKELRPGIGDWLFGCDVCQDVCPWNRKAPPGTEQALQPRPDLLALDAIELLGMGAEEFRRRFKGTALWRAKRRGMLRNACIVLGNRGDPEAMPALQQALVDEESLIREAAAWAIEQIKRTKNEEGRMNNEE